MGALCSSGVYDADSYQNVQPPESPTAVVEKNNLSLTDDVQHVLHIFTKKKLGWSTEQKVCNFQNIYIDEHGNILYTNGLQSNCIYIQRLSLILSKYKEYFLPYPNEYSTYRFIHADFGKYYSSTNLLNDYIHLIRYHSNSYIKKAQTTRYMKQNIQSDHNIFNIPTDCKPCKCRAVHRILKLPHIAISESSHNDDIEMEENVSKHLLDLVHSNLFHSEYIQQQHQNLAKFTTKSLFGISAKNKRPSCFSVNAMTERTNYYQITACFEYIKSSLDRHRRSRSNQLRHSDERIFIKPKYDNLKEEIVSNELLSLSVNQWDFIVCKAKKYVHGVFVKTIGSNRSVEHHWENDEVLNDSWNKEKMLNCVVSLLLLMDFDELAMSLRTSYLKKSKEETDDILARQHSNYWNLASCVKMVVELHGVVRSGYCSSQRDERIDYLWHCIDLQSKSIDITWLRLKCSFPVSTTKNLKLLSKRKHGIIVGLDKYDGCVFDCSWISKFQFLQEMLLIDCQIHRYGYRTHPNQLSYEEQRRFKEKEIITEPLPIHYIIDNDDNIESVDNAEADADKEYIQSIHSFIQIMNTEKVEPKEWFFRPTYHWNNESDALQKYRKNIIALIQNKFNKKHGTSIYAKNAIDSYFQNKTEFTMDFKMYRQNHLFLMDLFCVTMERATQDQTKNKAEDEEFRQKIQSKFEQSDSSSPNDIMDAFRVYNDKISERYYKRINIEFICYLFPNCKELKVFNVKTLGNIDKAFMEWLFNELSELKKHRSETEDASAPIQKYEFLIHGFIRKYYNQFIQENVLDLILLFYSNITNRIDKISFVHSLSYGEKLDEKEVNEINKMQDFVPRNWKVEVDINRYRQSLVLSFKGSTNTMDQT